MVCLTRAPNSYLLSSFQAFPISLCSSNPSFFKPDRTQPSSCWMQVSFEFHARFPKNSPTYHDDHSLLRLPGRGSRSRSSSDRSCLTKGILVVEDGEAWPI